MNRNRVLRPAMGLKSFSVVILVMKNQAEIVYEIFNKISMPTGKEKVYFPKGTDIPHHYEAVFNTRLVSRLNHKQAVFMGQLMFHEFGAHYKLLSVQQTYDMLRKDKGFKSTLERYYIPNKEVFLESGEIITDPGVKEVDGGLVYDGGLRCDGRKVEAEIDECHIFKTLNKAGLLKGPRKKTLEGSISFGKGESSAWSYWNTDYDALHTFARSPSARLTSGILAYVRDIERERGYKELYEKRREFLKTARGWKPTDIIHIRSR